MENAAPPSPHEDEPGVHHFTFASGEVGHLTPGCVVERLNAMTRNERELYDHRRFLPDRDRVRDRPLPPPAVDSEWRASVVKWKYQVVDHFDFPREVVAVSMSLFDRFFATGATPDSELVLSCSIASLHIALKTLTKGVIKLSTLLWFGRGRFTADRIACVEMLVLFGCRWLVHPPTSVAFVLHLLLLWDVSVDRKMEILESARFLCGEYRNGSTPFPSISSDRTPHATRPAELAVADSFFVGRRCSVIGAAAIMNALERHGQEIDPALSDAIRVSPADERIVTARRRLRLLFTANDRG